MNSRPWLLGVPLLCLAACSSTSNPHSPDSVQKFIGTRTVAALIPSTSDVYIVKIEPGTNPEQFAASLGLSLVRVLDEDTIVVSGVQDESVLENDADVSSFEQNQEVALAFGQELTMGFFEGVGFKASDLDSSQVMNPRDLLLVHSQWSGQGIRVAIIDTGADGEHPWLVHRIGPSEHCEDLGWLESANGIDDDNDGDIDEAYGHGTMVAGIVAQLAPEAQLISIRALNSDGIGSLADILTAMDALILDDVDVLNLSLSLSQYSELFETRLGRLRAAGISIVAAAGNQAAATAFPASSALTVGVAALDGASNLAGFTNAGPDCELAASGVGILSSFPENQLGWGDGTSFAAPIVAGAIALLKSGGFGEQQLLDTADPLTPLAHGQIDLVASFQVAMLESQAFHASEGE